MSTKSWISLAAATGLVAITGCASDTGKTAAPPVTTSTAAATTVAPTTVAPTTSSIASTTAPSATTPGTDEADTPITLKMAVSDGRDSPGAKYVTSFIARVKDMSGGSIDIVPTWEAGDGTPEGFEQGVIHLVTGGTFDIGFAASRAFDLDGINSFEALQAPFLVTENAVAEQIATGGLGAGMLADMTTVSNGADVGLAMWPEDLRHPFSIDSGSPVLEPADLAGQRVRTPPSKADWNLMTTLGGTPVYPNRYTAAESGLLNGNTLTGDPVATGNVTYYAKFQVLFASGTSLDRLTDDQQRAISEAASATQSLAIDEHQSEAEAAAAWCTVGSVVLATDTQVEAFEAAAQPAFDALMQDAPTADLIGKIRAITATVTPAPPIVACGPR